MPKIVLSQAQFRTLSNRADTCGLKKLCNALETLESSFVNHVLITREHLELIASSIESFQPFGELLQKVFRSNNIKEGNANERKLKEKLEQLLKASQHRLFRLHITREGYILTPYEG